MGNQSSYFNICFKIQKNMILKACLYWKTYFVPDSFLGTLNMLSHLFLLTQWSQYHYSYFTHEKTEVQNNELCLRPFTWSLGTVLNLTVCLCVQILASCMFKTCKYLRIYIVTKCWPTWKTKHSLFYYARLKERSIIQVCKISLIYLW